MTMKRHRWLLVGLLVGMGCFGTIESAHADKRLQVTVSIVPQQYFVEQIGADQVEVTVMVPPGAEPADYEPKPQQMVALASSKVYFAVGVPFESAWLKRFMAANPRMLIVHTETGIAKLPMTQELPIETNPKTGAFVVSPPREPSHEGVKDPHVWVSPPLVMIQARNILAALVQVDPAHKDLYEANYLRFISQLAELDMKIGNIFWGPKSAERKPFIVFHPAWAYFAAAYGLQQIPVQLGGNEPTAQELKRLILFARAKGIKVVFIQPEFSTRSARAIVENIGGRSVVADPLAKDWAKNLLVVAQQMRNATK
jgi:zinc transport system substrate-binding protein